MHAARPRPSQLVTRVPAETIGAYTQTYGQILGHVTAGASWASLKCVGQARLSGRMSVSIRTLGSELKLPLQKDFFRNISVLFFRLFRPTQIIEDKILYIKSTDFRF